MTIRIGNAPCSWGIEFANDDRNPPWEKVLAECAQAGYKGIELGPIGYFPEDPEQLGSALKKYDLELIGGVVFQPFHDASKWDKVLDAATRTCRSLQAHGAKHLVLIDSISPRRAPTAGRPDEAEQMSEAEWHAYVDRFRTIAEMGSKEYGLTVALHPHAGGFMDFLPEVERILQEIDEDILKICLDTGHCHYAGFDPIAFMQKHLDRISYMHFKTTDADIKADVIANQTGFYDACGQGIFCNLSDGEVNFNKVREVLVEGGFSGWCTVEQDCDPNLDPDSLGDARKNREYLESIGFV